MLPYEIVKKEEIIKDIMEPMILYINDRLCGLSKNMSIKRIKYLDCYNLKSNLTSNNDNITMLSKKYAFPEEVFSPLNINKEIWDYPKSAILEYKKNNVLGKLNAYIIKDEKVSIIMAVLKDKTTLKQDFFTMTIDSREAQSSFVSILNKIYSEVKNEKIKHEVDFDINLFKSRLKKDHNVTLIETYKLQCYK